MMKIKVFSDMVCPYCYVGKLRLDQAIERLGLPDVEVEFKAFQLHPTSPSEYSMPIYDFIRQAYGPGAVGNPAMRAQVLGAGKSVGLDFNYDIMRSCNTKKAVSGAQPVEVFMQALQKTQTICEEGTTCGPDGCYL